jgi:predicted nucleotidyltransferase component of viral defense system
MDELQDRLVRLALGVLADHGFALAGGYALQAHGLVERMSEDVDLFTDRWDSAEFGRAVNTVLDAYRHAGLDVTLVRQAETFARLQVIDPSSARTGSVDLAADRRDHNPARLSIGPVLAETDAVSTKVATVFSRGEARDYLDLAGILASGR